jgi:hypothetical protein
MQVKYITGIKYDRYARIRAARKLGRKISDRTPLREYGIYRQAEGPLSYIAAVENNAPSMSEKLWKIREQLTIAEKNIFDAVIELPPMEKRETARKVAEYTKLSEGVVRTHLSAVYAMIRDMDEFDNLKKSSEDLL